MKYNPRNKQKRNYKIQFTIVALRFAFLKYFSRLIGFHTAQLANIIVDYLQALTGLRTDLGRSSYDETATEMTILHSSNYFSNFFYDHSMRENLTI